jgi:ligand-binding SRPBCC domain-containing protein
MRPNARQIIPPKEKRRPPTPKIEEKPTLTPDNEEEKLSDQPSLNNRAEWTKDEIKQLITDYGLLAWPADMRTEAVNIVGLVQNLWQKQNGLCAVSDLPLTGPPGHLGSGIGINLLNWKFGLRKGNLRLVSCPFAITRLDFDEPIVDKLNDNQYKNLPISFAIFKHLQWAFEDCREFRHLPISIRFEEPSWKHQHKAYNDTQRSCLINLHIKQPTSPTISGYRKSEFLKTEIQHIVIKDDTITYIQKKHYVPGWNNLTRPYRHKYHSNILNQEITIKLHDPDDFIPRIVETTVNNLFLRLRSTLQQITNDWQMITNDWQPHYE